MTMPTPNPSPAAREAAEKIVNIIDNERHLKASQSWFRYDLATLIDQSLTDERRAAEELIETLSFHAIEPDGCYSRINTTELEQAIANYRRTRGGE